MLCDHANEELLQEISVRNTTVKFASISMHNTVEPVPKRQLIYASMITRSSEENYIHVLRVIL